MVLLSQDNLVYDNFHPLGPSKLTSLQISSFQNQNAIKMNMKNGLEWGKDICCRFFNATESKYIETWDKIGHIMMSI